MLRTVVIAVVIVVLGVPMISTSIVAFKKQVADAGRVIGMPGIASEDTFVGGLLSGSGNATWPMARLEFFDWGIRVGASGFFTRALVPTWEARYEELTTVRLVSQLFWPPGVRFAAKGSADAVVFWIGCTEQIAARLQAHGVPVDWSSVSLRKAGGICRTW